MRVTILVFSLLVLFIGCGGDDTVTPPVTTVTINIEIIPAGLEAPWELNGPNNYINSGIGNVELAGLEAGGYEISYGFVTEYITPENEQKTLSSGDEYVFTGNYVEGSGSTVDFVLIPSGTFTMGSPLSEPGYESNETEHTVTLTTSFYMSETEVTNRQYANLAQWALFQGTILKLALLNC